MNIPDVNYVACWTEDDGVYCCGHSHLVVREAMTASMISLSLFWLKKLSLSREKPGASCARLEFHSSWEFQRQAGPRRGAVLLPARRLPSLPLQPCVPPVQG